MLTLLVASVATVLGLGLFLFLGRPLLGLSAGGGPGLAMLARRGKRYGDPVNDPADALAAVAMAPADEVLDPTAGTGHRTPIQFAAKPARGVDRCRVGSRLVPLRSEPGDLLGSLIGRLDVGDEVDVLRQDGTYCYVRTPSGAEGWLPGMALLSAAAPPSFTDAAPVAQSAVEVSAQEPATSATPHLAEPGEPAGTTVKRPRRTPAGPARPMPARRKAEGGAA